MSEFTRKASLFGGPKVVLGTESTDLVLETLGKIYIKTGKKARLLNDVFKLLDNLNDPKEDVGGKTFIVETLSDLQNTFKYPGDGYLIFVSQEKSLYISYDDRYLLLIEEVVDPNNNTPEEVGAPGFVRRRGDKMTGQLEIAVGEEKAPLIIASSKLVKNLNVQFLNGYASHEVAIKKLNEYILGNWTFEKDTQFNANVNVASDITVGNDSYVQGNQEVGYDLLVKNKATVKQNLHVEKDIVLTGSIGSPEFMSGYNGYGWRFDADTNMLTVDYLVVRKAMQVFELVVNRIQATNGSLWVTDSCEVKEVFEILEPSDLDRTMFTDAASAPDPEDNTYSETATEVGYPANRWLAFGKQIVPVHGKHLKSVNGIYEDENIEYVNFSWIVKVNDPSKVRELIDSEGTLSVEERFDYFTNIIQETTPEHAALKATLLETKNSDSEHILQCVPVIDSTFYDAIMLSTDNKAEFDSLEEITVLKTFYKYFGLTKERYDLQQGIYNMSVVKMNDNTYATFDQGDIIRCQKFENGNVKYYDALVGSRIDAYTYVIIKSPSIFDQQVIVSTNADGDQTVSTELNVNQYNKSFYGYYIETANTIYNIGDIIYEANSNYAFLYNTRQFDKTISPLFISDQYIENVKDFKHSDTSQRYITEEEISDYPTVFKDSTGYFILERNSTVLDTVDYVPAFSGTYLNNCVNVNNAYFKVIEESIDGETIQYISYYGEKCIIIDNKVTVEEQEYEATQEHYSLSPIMPEGDDRIVTLIKYNECVLPDENFICYILSDNQVEYDDSGQVKDFYIEPETSEGFELDQIQTSRVLADISAKDGLVRVGNLMNTERQNSVFITSSEWDSPYVQTMAGVCRPDYTVAYKQPKFSKWKVKTKTSAIRFTYLEISNTAKPNKTYLSNTETDFIKSILDKDTYNTFDEVRKCLVKKYYDGFILNDVYYTFVSTIPNNDAECYNKFLIETKTIIKDGVEQIKYLATYCDHIKARFGKLDGIEHENFSNNDLTQPHGYGLYGENVYLTGEFVLSNGKSIATIGDDILFKVAKSGLHITEDGIVLDADKIQINNGDKIAALFKDGKILAEYID